MIFHGEWVEIDRKYIPWQKFLPHKSVTPAEPEKVNASSVKVLWQTTREPALNVSPPSSSTPRRGYYPTPPSPPNLCNCAQTCQNHSQRAVGYKTRKHKKLILKAFDPTSTLKRLNISAFILFLLNGFRYIWIYLCFIIHKYCLMNTSPVPFIPLPKVFAHLLVSTLNNTTASNMSIYRTSAHIWSN